MVFWCIHFPRVIPCRLSTHFGNSWTGLGLECRLKWRLLLLIWEDRFGSGTCKALHEGHSSRVLWRIWGEPVSSSVNYYTLQYQNPAFKSDSVSQSGKLCRETSWRVCFSHRSTSFLWLKEKILTLFEGGHCRSFKQSYFKIRTLKMKIKVQFVYRDSFLAKT